MIINIGQEDAVAKVKEMTDGYGADVYLEGTGHPSAVRQGLNLLRKLGTYVEYSVFGSRRHAWTGRSSAMTRNSTYAAPTSARTAGRQPSACSSPVGSRSSGSVRINCHLADFQKGLDMVASGKESIKVSLIP